MTQFDERIDKEAALAIHSAAIARFGGLDGVHDDGLAEWIADNSPEDVIGR